MIRIATHQPSFLPWVGYYHKMLTVDLFVYMHKSQFTKRNYQNRALLNGNWLTIPLKSASQSDLICNRYPVAGWNDKSGKLYKTLIQYANSRQCKFPDRILMLTEEMAAIPATASLADVNEHMDNVVVTMLYRLARIPPNAYPRTDRMGSAHGDTKTGRLVSILDQARPEDMYVYSYIGEGAAKGYYDEQELPDWIRCTKVQKRVMPDTQTESILRVIGEESDPWAYVIEAFHWQLTI